LRVNKVKALALWEICTAYIPCITQWGLALLNYCMFTEKKVLNIDKGNKSKFIITLVKFF
jgi:hypothetical protein